MSFEIQTLERTKVIIKKLNNSDVVNLPRFETDGSAGMDLAANITKNIIIEPGKWDLIPTGVHIAMPYGMEAQVRPRSGLAAKFGVTVLNSPGTIDADYRGEIKAILINHGSENFVITSGTRIAQLVFAKYEKVLFEEMVELPDSERGDGGFGSTGM